MPAQAPSQRDVPIDVPLEIAAHQVHQRTHVAAAALDHARHVDGVHLVALVPRLVGPFADQPATVIRHVKRQSDEASPLAPGVLPLL